MDFHTQTHTQKNHNKNPKNKIDAGECFQKVKHAKRCFVQIKT